MNLRVHLICTRLNLVPFFYVTSAAWRQTRTLDTRVLRRFVKREKGGAHLEAETYDRPGGLKGGAKPRNKAASDEGRTAQDEIESNGSSTMRDECLGCASEYTHNPWEEFSSALFITDATRLAHNTPIIP